MSKKPKVLKSQTHVKISIYLPPTLYRKTRATAIDKGFRGFTAYIEAILKGEAQAA